MIRRETTPDLLHAISHSEGVRPFVCYIDGEMDWQPVVASDRCIVLSNGDDAVSVFEETSPRFYQAHTMFGEDCRGRKAFDVAREMIDAMIPAHADALWGAIPVHNRRARWFHRQLGAESLGLDEFETEGEVEIFFYGRKH
jgi:hypothetical protein